MPLAQHPDFAISCTEPDNDVFRMNVVLSPPTADGPALHAPRFSPSDGLALELDRELPPSSFRLQFLRAWIAARGGRPAEVAGHA